MGQNLPQGVFKVDFAPTHRSKAAHHQENGRIERFHDSGGLYLELSAAGGKHWRWKYSFKGKEKRLSFGAWPDVSLKEAREKRDAYRKTLKEGTDPGKEKGLAKPSHQHAGIATFQMVADEWVRNQKNVWVDTHAETVESRLASNIYPYIGGSPIADVTPQDVLALLRRIEERGAYEVAKRVLGICSLVFRYGVAIGAHGFRSMASILLNEAGHDPDVIEAQLAHTGADKIRAIYNRAQYMDRRRVLMQAWADYLDELRSSAL